jgi:predicted aspartyl protease
MAIVYFPSPDAGDVVEVVFLKPGGSAVSMSLLVDSGFTGQSCFVLPADAEELAQAAATPSQTAGALSGTQRRVVVTCRIPGLSFEHSLLAILTDVSALDLPPGVRGMAGLRFLRSFRRWGAEQTGGGSWRFFLSDDPEKSTDEPVTGAI